MSIKEGVFEVNLLNILVELEIYSEIIKYDRNKNRNHLYTVNSLHCCIERDNNFVTKTPLSI